MIIQNYFKFVVQKVNFDCYFKVIHFHPYEKIEIIVN